jgi:hypothetical protein
MSRESVSIVLSVNCLLGYERQIREQMTDMFAASGFDAKRDIAGMISTAWGHPFINPQPGFFFGLNGNPAPREALRAGALGRIAFSTRILPVPWIIGTHSWKATGRRANC